jgi:hypothetical protein
MTPGQDPAVLLVHGFASSAGAHVLLRLDFLGC